MSGGIGTAVALAERDEPATVTATGRYRGRESATYAE